MKYIPNAITFGNQSRSSSLIINIIFGIASLDPKSKTWTDVVSRSQCARFHEIWYVEQVEYTNYEYINWN